MLFCNDFSHTCSFIFFLKTSKYHLGTYKWIEMIKFYHKRIKTWERNNGQTYTLNPGNIQVNWQTLSHTRNVFLWVLQVNPQCIWSPCDAFVLILVRVWETWSLSSLASNQAMKVRPCLVLTTLQHQWRQGLAAFPDQWKKKKLCLMVASSFSTNNALCWCQMTIKNWLLRSTWLLVSGYSSTIPLTPA